MELNTYFTAKKYAIFYQDTSLSKFHFYKQLTHLQPGLPLLEALQKEHILLNRIRHPSIERAIGVTKIDNSTFIELEYFGGKPLENWIRSRKVTLSEALHIAIKISEAVSFVHSSGYIHYNLSTESILLSMQPMQVRICRFTYAVAHNSRLFKNHKTFPSQASAFLAPEINIGESVFANEQIDIYALGHVFERLIKSSIDNQQVNMKLTHSPQIENIIVKLGAIINRMRSKTQSERYQDLSSVLVDLKICNESLIGDTTLPDFEIDQCSFSTKVFHYLLADRQPQLVEFNQILKSNQSHHKSQYVHIHGASGIGKSTFVQAALRAQSHNILYATIKFDQFQSVAPLEPLFVLLRTLIKHTLLQTPDSLLDIKRYLNEELFSYSGILVQRIPELSFLIDINDSNPQLQPKESKALFQRSIIIILNAITRFSKPVYLFLDDIQWADNNTFSWLKESYDQLQQCTIIFAYRDTPSDLSDYSKRQVLLIKDLPIQQHSIELKPISKNTLLATFNKQGQLSPPQAEKWAQDILKKTQGNPFFVHEYLQQAQDKGCIYLNLKNGDWLFDSNQIDQIPISNNVFETLSLRFNELAAEQQKLLSIASCVGTTIPNHILEALVPQESVAELIKLSIDSGWLLPNMSEIASVRFAHDRLQQAAHHAQSSSAVLQHHYNIAQYYKNNSQSSEALLKCVHHFHLSMPLVESDQLRAEIAGFNVLAARETKQRGDFERAYQHINRAFKLMSGSAPHLLSSEVFQELGECCHLFGLTEEANEHLLSALKTSNTSLERAAVYDLLIKLNTDIGQYDDAYAIGRTALQELGIKIPATYKAPLLISTLARLTWQLKGKSTLDLFDLPKAEDQTIIATISLLSALQKAAYQIKPELCVYLAAKQVSLSIKHGNSPDAAIGYMVFGVIFQCGILGRRQAGVDYGQLSLALLEKYDAKRLASEVSFVYGYFGHSWSFHTYETEALWKSAISQGAIVGDWFHMACAKVSLIQNKLMRGASLDECLVDCNKAINDLQRHNAHFHIELLLAIKQLILRFKYRPQGHDDLWPESRLKEHEERLLTQGAKHFAHMYFINKMTLGFLQDDLLIAEEALAQAKSCCKESKGLLHSTEHLFIETLITLRIADKNQALISKAIHKLRQTIKQFHKFNARCSDNFLDRLLLLQAELSYLLGEPSKAFKLYQDSSHAAGLQGHLNIQFLIHIQLSRKYESSNQRIAAHSHQNRAYELGCKWGIFGEEQDWTSALLPNATQKQSITTLAQSTEAIAQTRRLEDLMDKIIQIMQANTGAKRVVLLIEEQNELKIAADSNQAQHSHQPDLNAPQTFFGKLPAPIIHYIYSAKEAQIIENASTDTLFRADSYVSAHNVLSVLCAPLILQGQLKGAIYIENNELPKAFNRQHLDFIYFLRGQIAISIENIRIYQTLEDRVAKRTRDIEAQKQALQSQNQTIQHLNQELERENSDRRQFQEELHQANQQLEKLALTDPLTQLPNRRYFDSFFDTQQLVCRQKNQALAIILCDVDYFKFYNDRYGHESGDSCLKEVASCFHTLLLSDRDLAARIGGEEFIIVLANHSLEEIEQLTQGIHQALAAKQILHEASTANPFITMSIGVSYSNDSDTFSSLIKQADKALYQAKRQGRNQTVFHNKLPEATS